MSHNNQKESTQISAKQENVEPPLSEAEIGQIEQFLNLNEVTAYEAQMIFEVSTYRQHHIGLPSLAKKMPKRYKKSMNELEETAKLLCERGILEPYESKKENICLRLGKKGRDLSLYLKRQGFADNLPRYDESVEMLTEKRKHLCADHLGLKIGEIRTANGPHGKTSVQICGITAADSIYSEVNGVEYDRLVSIKVDCPKCHYSIETNYTYNPTTLWVDWKDITCGSCKYFFQVSYSLFEYDNCV